MGEIRKVEFRHATCTSLPIKTMGCDVPERKLAYTPTRLSENEVSSGQSVRDFHLDTDSRPDNFAC